MPGGEVLQPVSGYPLVAVQILGYVQRERQGMTAFVFQRGSEPLHPMGFTLSPFVQNDVQVIAVPDKGLDAVVWIYDSFHFRKQTSGFQQGAFIQVLTRKTSRAAAISPLVMFLPSMSG